MQIPSVQLCNKAVECGGFTYRIKDGAYPTTGFVVSVAGPERKLAGISSTAIDAFVRDNRQTFEAANIVFRGGACLGAWWNKGDARWYLDLSIVVPTLDEALALGRLNGQLAVFNLDDGQSVAIPYYPEEAPEPLTAQVA